MFWILVAIRIIVLVFCVWIAYKNPIIGVAVAMVLFSIISTVVAFDKIEEKQEPVYIQCEENYTVVELTEAEKPNTYTCVRK